LLVAVGSFLACCLVVLWYGVRSAGALAGGIAGALFALAPPVTQAARLATPDTLTMLLVTVAAILFVRGRLLLAACLLTAGVLVRTDLEVFDVCLAGAWLLLGRREPGRFGVAGILAASVPVSAAVNAWAGNYGYVVLYRFTFVEGNVPHPASLRGLGFPFGSLVPNIEAGVKYSLENGGLWMVLALLGLCVTLLARGFGGRDRMCEALLLAVGLSTAVRFVLFPELDLRLVAPAVAVLTVVVLTIGGRGRGWVRGEKTRGLSTELKEDSGVIK
jgi:4-amino-4-deoxy-L-arabinose transferase-like glycosyltransferase